MAPTTVEEYLAGLTEPARGTLEEVRRRIVEIIPQAEPGISYSVPAFRVQGKVVAGLAAFRNHLSYLPHSGSVLSQFAEELSGYDQTKSALHFPIDQPLAGSVIALLIDAKLRQLGLR